MEQDAQKTLPEQADSVTDAVVRVVEANAACRLGDLYRVTSWPAPLDAQNGAQAPEIIVPEPSRVGAERLSARAVNGGVQVADSEGCALFRRAPAVTNGEYAAFDACHVCAVLNSRLMQHYCDRKWRASGESLARLLERAPLPRLAADLSAQLRVLWAHRGHCTPRRRAMIDGSIERVVVEAFRLDIDALMTLQLHVPGAG